MKSFWLIFVMTKLEMKISLVSIKNNVIYPIHGGSVHTGCYICIISWFIQYIYYLSTCNRRLFKSCYCYVLFFPFEKSFQHYEKYIFVPKFSVNKYKKQMYYQENKSLFFDVMKNGQIFPSEVFHFQYDHILLFSREMGNITWKEIRLKKLIKFESSGYYSFWHLSSCL